jgi:hypothetical protein
MPDTTPELIREFDYMLTTPFDYADGSGQMKTAVHIQLTAPSSQQRRYCAVLKQAFCVAITRDTGDAATNEPVPKTIKGEDVMLTIAMSSDIQLDDIMDTAYDLFTTPGIAMVDGQKKLTKHMLNDMDMEDLEGMLGDYLVKFTLRSTLAKMKEDSSLSLPD